MQATSVKLFKLIFLSSSRSIAVFHALQTLLRYLGDEARDKLPMMPFIASEWRCEVVADAPQQLNSWNCGVFTCMFAYYLSAGRTPAFTQEDVPRFRRRMLLDICNLRVD
jgi:sentrin-specific protease 1